MNPSFYDHFAARYQDRWSGLMGAMLQKNRLVGLRNPYAALQTQEAVRSHPACTWSDAAFLIPPGSEPNQTSNGLLDYYLMDLASLIPVLALDVMPGLAVLDLCAAPGGKALMMAFKLGNAECLHVNDLSKRRFFKMKKVFEDYLPQEHFKQLQFSCRDGLWFGLHMEGRFDRVLLDAPCSSERHLMLQNSTSTQWTPSRTRQLAKRQYGLLTSALRALKPGGRLVYSTCSISPQENDGVIERLVEKGRHHANILSPRLPMGERTEYGTMVMPDTCEGWGPIYTSTLEKTG